jgi:hypothetical protein
MANLPPSFYKFNKSYSTASQSTKGLAVPLIATAAAVSLTTLSNTTNCSTTIESKLELNNSRRQIDARGIPIQRLEISSSSNSFSSSSLFTKSFSSRQVNSSTTFNQPFLGGQEFCVVGKKAPKKKICTDALCAVPECLPSTKEVSSDDESDISATAPDDNSDASSKEEGDDNSITSSTEDLEDAFDDDSPCTEGPIKKLKKENRPIEKEERQKWDAQSLKFYASSNYHIYMFDLF